MKCELKTVLINLCEQFEQIKNIIELKILACEHKPTMRSV